MGRQLRCVTNNPLMAEQHFSEMEYYETDVLGLFKIVEKEVRDGYTLLTHPLTGSIRPDITPYKTVLLEECPDQETHEESLRLIQHAIQYAENLYQLRKIPMYQRWDEKAKKDFRYIDFSIIERALDIAQIRM